MSDYHFAPITGEMHSHSRVRMSLKSKANFLPFFNCNMSDVQMGIQASITQVYLLNISTIMTGYLIQSRFQIQNIYKNQVCFKSSWQHLKLVVSPRNTEGCPNLFGADSMSFFLIHQYICRMANNIG